MIHFFKVFLGSLDEREGRAQRSGNVGSPSQEMQQQLSQSSTC